MESKRLKLTSQLKCGPPEELIFETVETNSHILRAQILRDGKAHSLYVLAIPEDSIEDFKEEEFTDNVVAEPEMA